MYSSTPSLYFYFCAVCTQIHTKHHLYQEASPPLLFLLSRLQTKSSKDRKCFLEQSSHTRHVYFLFCGKDVFPLDDWNFAGYCFQGKIQGKLTNLNNWDASANIKVAKRRVACQIVNYVIHSTVDIAPIRAVSGWTVLTPPVSCVTLDFLHSPRE